MSVNWITWLNCCGKPDMQLVSVCSLLMCQYWLTSLQFCTRCQIVSVCVCVFTDASPQSCLTCDWGSTLKDNVCYPQCKEGQYFSEQV